MTQPTTAYTLTPEKNPANGRVEIAVRFGTMHCGYADSNLGAEQLAQEIARKREAAAPAPACHACGDEGDCPDCHEMTWRDNVRAAYAARAAATPAPKSPRRKKATCTCPACTPDGQPNANGSYYCKTDKTFIGYHDGALIAAGNYIHIQMMLNDHRHTLLSKPLPSATPEEIADVLAAARLAA